MRHGGGGCGGGVHRGSGCGPESGPARRSGYYIEVPPVERTRSGGRCASLHRLLVVAGRLVAHRAAPVALVCGLACAAVAQPAPRPRPAAPPKPAPARRRRSIGGSSPSSRSSRRGANDYRRVAVRPLGDRRRPPVRARRAAGVHFVFALATGAGLYSLPYPTKLAPVVADGRVLVTGDTIIDALKADDGSPLWKALLAAPAAFAPIARGGWVFVALTDGAVAGLRADTGVAVWRAAIGQPAAAPVVEGDRLYAAATGGALQALSVTDGTPVWRATLDGDATAMAAVAGHVFVATSGRWLYDLDAATRQRALALSHPGRGDRAGRRRGSCRRGDARPGGPGLQDRQRRAGLATGACLPAGRRAGDHGGQRPGHRLRAGRSRDRSEDGRNPGPLQDPAADRRRWHLARDAVRRAGARRARHALRRHAGAGDAARTRARREARLRSAGLACHRAAGNARAGPGAAAGDARGCPARPRRLPQPHPQRRRPRRRPPPPAHRRRSRRIDNGRIRPRTTRYPAGVRPCLPTDRPIPSRCATPRQRPRPRPPLAGASGAPPG